MSDYLSQITLRVRFFFPFCSHFLPYSHPSLAPRAEASITVAVVKILTPPLLLAQSKPSRQSEFSMLIGDFNYAATTIL